MKKTTYIFLSFILALAVSCEGEVNSSFYDHPHHNTGSGTPDNPDTPGPDEPSGPEYDETVYELDQSLWKTVQVSDGVVWKNFEATDVITGAPQIVNVLDVDLEAKKNDVKLVYYYPSVTPSAAFSDQKAVGVINAGYELNSIFVKVAGNTYGSIKNSYINNTVPQWKNDGAIFIDGDDVKIAYSGKGMKVSAQRQYYLGCSEPNILSSAPMLIDDSEPVGEVFAKTDLTYEQLITLDSEDPLRHQGIRHPRTAVAKTSDNHLLLITVDGRRETVSAGMTARELTIFLKNWFKPQYALNLDGGGSTTMCVKDQGDPSTHVVNYPCDNGQFDHAGERARDTHICVVPR